MEGAAEDRGIQIGGDENQPVFPFPMGEIEQHRHPLLMPTVLEALFQQMPRKQLATCRLVCKEWWNESLSTWRSKAIIMITTNSESRRQCQLSVKEFHKFWGEAGNKCVMKPFQRFRIFGGYADFENDCLELTTPIWQSIGVNMIHLELIGYKFPSVQKFREIIYEACPQLQRLTMKFCSVNNPSTGNSVYPTNDRNAPYTEPEFGERTQLKSLDLNYCLPDSWLNLLSHFTGLDDIPDSEIYHDWILEAVEKIRRKDPRKLPLKHFKARVPAYSNRGLNGEAPMAISYYSDLVYRLRIPADFLIVTLRNDIDRHSVRSILRLHADTLTAMEFFDERSEHASLEFPTGVEFPNLQKLGLYGRICDNFQFLKYMPYLKELRINLDMEENVPFQPHHMFSNSLNLMESDLKLGFVDNLQLDFTVSDDDFKCLIKWMPDLRSLKMPLNTQQIRLACEHWGKCINKPVDARPWGFRLIPIA